MLHSERSKVRFAGKPKDEEDNKLLRYITQYILWETSMRAATRGVFPSRSLLFERRDVGLCDVLMSNRTTLVNSSLLLILCLSYLSMSYPSLSTGKMIALQ